MVRSPAARTFASVPLSSTGVSSDWASAGPACSSTARHAARTCFMRLRRNEGARLDAALVLVRFGGRQQLAFPLGNHCGGDRIADRVGGRAAHVEERIDAENEKQAGLRNVELV